MDQQLHYRTASPGDQVEIMARLLGALPHVDHFRSLACRYATSEGVRQPVRVLRHIGPMRLLWPWGPTPALFMFRRDLGCQDIIEAKFPTSSTNKKLWLEKPINVNFNATSVTDGNQKDEAPPARASTSSTDDTTVMLTQATNVHQSCGAGATHWSE